MVDALCATWKLVDSKHFDDYMKAIGEQVLVFCIFFLLEIKVNCLYYVVI